MSKVTSDSTPYNEKLDLAACDWILLQAGGLPYSGDDKKLESLFGCKTLEDLKKLSERYTGSSNIQDQLKKKWKQTALVYSVLQQSISRQDSLTATLKQAIESACQTNSLGPTYLEEIVANVQEVVIEATTRCLQQEAELQPLLGQLTGVCPAAHLAASLRRQKFMIPPFVKGSSEGSSDQHKNKFQSPLVDSFLVNYFYEIAKGVRQDHCKLVKLYHCFSEQLTAEAEGSNQHFYWFANLLAFIGRNSDQQSCQPQVDRIFVDTEGPFTDLLGSQVSNDASTKEWIKTIASGIDPGLPAKFGLGESLTPQWKFETNDQHLSISGPEYQYTADDGVIQTRKARVPTTLLGFCEAFVASQPANQRFATELPIYDKLKGFAKALAENASEHPNAWSTDDDNALETGSWLIETVKCSSFWLLQSSEGSLFDAIKALIQVDPALDWSIDGPLELSTPLSPPTDLSGSARRDWLNSTCQQLSDREYDSDLRKQLLNQACKWATFLGGEIFPSVDEYGQIEQGQLPLPNDSYEVNQGGSDWKITRFGYKFNDNLHQKSTINRPESPSRLDLKKSLEDLSATMKPDEHLKRIERTINHIDGDRVSDMVRELNELCYPRVNPAVTQDKTGTIYEQARSYCKEQGYDLVFTPGEAYLNSDIAQHIDYMSEATRFETDFMKGKLDNVIFTPILRKSGGAEVLINGTFKKVT